MVTLRPLSGLKIPSVWMILLRASYTPLYCALGSGCKLCILVCENENIFNSYHFHKRDLLWAHVLGVVWQQGYSSDWVLVWAKIMQSLFHFDMPSYLDITVHLFVMKYWAGSGNRPNPSSSECSHRLPSFGLTIKYHLHFLLIQFEQIEVLYFTSVWLCDYTHVTNHRMKTKV